FHGSKRCTPALIGFEQHARHGLRLYSLLAETPLEEFERTVSSAVAIGKFHLHEAWIEIDDPFLEGRNTARLLRSERAAMKRFIEAHDHVLGASTGLQAMRTAQLDGAFYGFRAGGEQEDFFQRIRQNRNQLFDETRADLAGEVEIREQLRLS